MTAVGLDSLPQEPQKLAPCLGAEPQAMHTMAFSETVFPQLLQNIVYVLSLRDPTMAMLPVSPRLSEGLKRWLGHPVDMAR